MSPEEVLLRLGPPAQRDGGTFTYCLGGDRTARLSFDEDGRLVRADRSKAQSEDEQAELRAHTTGGGAQSEPAVAADWEEVVGGDHDHAAHHHDVALASAAGIDGPARWYALAFFAALLLLRLGGRRALGARRSSR
jgi:hypothetical protein